MACTFFSSAPVRPKGIAPVGSLGIPCRFCGCPAGFVGEQYFHDIWLAVFSKYEGFKTSDSNSANESASWPESDRNIVFI